MLVLVPVELPRLCRFPPTGLALVHDPRWTGCYMLVHEPSGRIMGERLPSRQEAKALVQALWNLLGERERMILAGPWGWDIRSMSGRRHRIDQLLQPWEYKP